MRVPTFKVYKNGREVVINETDLSKWQEQGFSLEGNNTGLQNMKKQELIELAKERGFNSKYMNRINKSDIIEALGSE